jgi:hypothetical protein
MLASWSNLWFLRLRLWAHSAIIRKRSHFENNKNEPPQPQDMFHVHRENPGTNNFSRGMGFAHNSSTLHKAPRVRHHAIVTSSQTTRVSIGRIFQQKRLSRTNRLFWHSLAFVRALGVKKTDEETQSWDIDRRQLDADSQPWLAGKEPGKTHTTVLPFFFVISSSPFRL